MQVRWREAWRIIASRHPPIDLFERVAGGNRAISDAMIALEEFTNPRLRDEIGEILLVPKDRRVSGPGASYVMAPFTHINPMGSRFADGSYGVYYAASKLGTAIAETIFHFEQFAADSNDPSRPEDMRVLVGRLSADLVDLCQENEPLKSQLLDPSDYSVSREWGRKLRKNGANGILFPSVRVRAGQCVALFWPNVPGIPVQERHLQYHWNGERVDRYFDYSEETWHDRDPAPV